MAREAPCRACVRGTDGRDARAPGTAGRARGSSLNACIEGRRLTAQGGPDVTSARPESLQERGPTPRMRWCTTLGLVAALLGSTASVWAETRWAVIVSGASGGEKLASETP